MRVYYREDGKWATATFVLANIQARPVIQFVILIEVISLDATENRRSMRLLRRRDAAGAMEWGRCLFIEGSRGETNRRGRLDNSCRRAGQSPLFKHRASGIEYGN